jgi:hypothetical protein
VIIRSDMRFGKATEPTERKGTHVEPNRFGSSDDPKPNARLEPGKRMEIREVRGRLEVVECE